MKRIKRFFKWKYARFVIGLSQRTKKYEELSDIQKRTLDIVNTLIRDQDADLLYAPVSEKRFIQKDNLFVSIQAASTGCIVSISGVHKSEKLNYHYDIWFSDSHHNLLKTRFAKSIDKRRSTVEKELLDRDKQSLDKILDELRKRK